MHARDRTGLATTVPTGAAQGRRRRAALSGALAMAVGTVAVFGLLLLVNRLALVTSRSSGASAAGIEISRPERPPAPKRIERRQPPRRVEDRTPPPPSLAALDPSLAGIELGMPALDLDGLDAGARELLGDARAVTMTSDTVDEPPRPVRRWVLPYPASARAKGIEGWVLLSILVDEQGAVESARVVEADPAGLFDEAALEGVRAWEFEPGLYRGERVSTWVRQRIRFDLG